MKEKDLFYVKIFVITKKTGNSIVIGGKDEPPK